jgi:hypothetical protein
MKFGSKKFYFIFSNDLALTWAPIEIDVAIRLEVVYDFSGDQ